MTVSQVSSSVSQPAARSPDTISVAVQPGLPRLKVDDGALAQVVLNLLDNAWKYGRAQGAESKEQKIVNSEQAGGGNGESRRVQSNIQHSTFNTQRPTTKNQEQTPRATVVVTVEAVEQAKLRRWWERKRRWIRISVTDHGEGIRKRDLGKIFREFYRAPNAGEKNTSGVGLGLALCKHVADAHGGWIEAESEAGKGSTFSVYLPAG